MYVVLDSDLIVSIFDLTNKVLFSQNTFFDRSKLAKIRSLAKYFNIGYLFVTQEIASIKCDFPKNCHTMVITRQITYPCLWPVDARSNVLFSLWMP